MRLRGGACHNGLGLALDFARGDDGGVRGLECIARLPCSAHSVGLCSALIAIAVVVIVVVSVEDRVDGGLGGRLGKMRRRRREQRGEVERGKEGVCEDGRETAATGSAAAEARRRLELLAKRRSNVHKYRKTEKV